MQTKFTILSKDLHFFQTSYIILNPMTFVFVARHLATNQKCFYFHLTEQEQRKEPKERVFSPSLRGCLRVSCISM